MKLRYKKPKGQRIKKNAFYIAVNVGRPKELQFGIDTWQWWVQVSLVTLGGIILYNHHLWF